MGLDNRDPRPGEIARVGGHRRQPVLNKKTPTRTNTAEASRYVYG